MAIARQLELTLVGDADRKREILDGLQALGAVHLVDVKQGAQGMGPDVVDDAREALRYLEDCPRKRRPRRAGSEIDFAQLVDEVLGNKHCREDAIDRVELLEQRRRDLRPWGEFEFPPPGELDRNLLWFYLVPVGREAGLEQVGLPWQLVHSDKRFHYLVVVSPQEPTDADVPYARVHTGSLSLSQIAEKLDEVRASIEEMEAERESLTRWIPQLRSAMLATLDRRDLDAAERDAYEADGLFAVRGWIPEAAVQRLAEWVASVSAAYTLREPDEEDTPPTLLLNGDRVGGGQEAVSFFQLPGYTNWDPSALVFVSFSLFFAMIAADAGYGALMALPLVFGWRRFSTPGSTAIRLRNLWAAIAACTIVYGVLVGSYFGMRPPPHSVPAALALLDLNDFDTMMRLSIAVGVLHLMIAHATVFWTNRGTRVAMVALAWFIGVGSGFGLWMQYVTADDFAAAASPFSYGLLAWLVLLLVFSGERPYDSVKNAGLNLVSGVGALTGLTKAFGDVLSYMRLFALGLASSSLATTFNELAVSARDSFTHAGFFAFLLIILLGHTLNFVLTLMSGLIHGLRLNLMEFYNWGIRDEGYPFKAFAKRGGSTWKGS